MPKVPSKELETVGKYCAIIIAIAPASLILSFFYDWGYFSTLGISFSDIPTELSDHMRSALVWFPKVALSVVVPILVIQILTIRIEIGKLIRILNIIYRYAILGWIIVLTWLLGVVGTQILIIGLFLFWLALIEWAFKRPDISDRYSHLLPGFLNVASISVFLLFSLGHLTAIKDMTRKGNSHEIYLIESINGQKSFKTNVLRTSKNWLLVHSENDNVRWIKLDQIKQIDKLKDEKYFEGLACKYFQRFC